MVKVASTIRWPFRQVIPYNMLSYWLMLDMLSYCHTGSCWTCCHTVILAPRWNSYCFTGCQLYFKIILFDCNTLNTVPVCIIRLLLFWVIPFYKK
ncbi:hypothetical protein CEXT_687301 [Caerostris extrusa]|uniref:Uncharacterized protein n=1 Tax=Caerostris extrusa TaxID=172846 RepID=A0AAV4V6B1_CAEEX|nr:hypothetical protein CEXT_687301 [Caerostris extrusa]